jgi:hypothetical protein
MASGWLKIILVHYEGDLSIYIALITVADHLMRQVRVSLRKSEPECVLGTLASLGYGGKPIQTRRAGHECDRRDYW